MKRSRAALSLALALLVLFRGGAARAADPVACVTASDEGQTLRDAGKLRAARERFLACASSECPKVITKDCIGWLAELEQRLPSIVPSAVDAEHHDVSAVRVLVDGTLALERLDGRAVPIDPGAHVLRFEPQAPAAAVEERVVIHEGEKRRLVSVVLSARKSEAAAGDARKEPSATPVLGYALAGVAVLSFGAFAYLWSAALDRVGELDRECAPHCSSGDISNLKTRVVVADVALGIGIAAAAGAIGVLVLRPFSKASPATARSSPLEVRIGGSGGVQLGGRF